MDDAFQVHLLGGHQREAGPQVEAHLVAEHGERAGAGAVGFLGAVVEQVLEQVEVGAHGVKVSRRRILAVGFAQNGAAGGFAQRFAEVRRVLLAIYVGPTYLYLRPGQQLGGKVLGVRGAGKLGGVVGGGGAFGNGEGLPLRVAQQLADEHDLADVVGVVGPLPVDGFEYGVALITDEDFPT